MGRGFVISPNFEGSNLGEPKVFWVPQELSVRASDVWCLLAAGLHLREGPRNHPKAGPWLELAWSAVSRVVSFLGHQFRARNSGTAGLAFSGLGMMPRVSSPFCGEEGQAEKQGAEQAGEH